MPISNTDEEFDMNPKKLLQGRINQFHHTAKEYRYYMNTTNKHERTATSLKEHLATWSDKFILSFEDDNDRYHVTAHYKCDKQHSTILKRKNGLYWCIELEGSYVSLAEIKRDIVNLFYKTWGIEK